MALERLAAAITDKRRAGSWARCAMIRERAAALTRDENRAVRCITQATRMMRTATSSVTAEVAADDFLASALDASRAEF